MGAIPGDIDTDRQPPMTLPLRHFLVGGGFLLVGSLVAVWSVVGGGRVALAHVHLLLVGWVCVTIMGAMTQFVPVWSGVALHSRRLASAQLWLVTAGLAGFASALLAGAYDLLALPGAAMLAGFWVFVYNIGRTLTALESYDVTERHFAFALGCFLLVTVLGLVLAVGFAVPGVLPVPRPAAVAAHATLAVFGAVLATVHGALYQLGTMFTGTDRDRTDRLLQRAETAGYPFGVLALAAGRLFAVPVVARLGGVLVVAGTLAVAIFLARHLRGATVDWTPMLTRYAVAALALAAWALTALPGWLHAPTSPARTFGGPSTHLLVLGGIGFVVAGTLYHIVPFIVWVHRYSDRVGLEPVPVVDDLYSDRLAASDFALLVGGTAVLLTADAASLPPVAAAVGGLLVTLGVVAFGANLLGVLRSHAPRSLGAILLGSWGGDRQAGQGASEDSPAPPDGHDT
ncbi:MAG: hypothetical protein ABEJ30_02720 [Halorientalis sp.]